MREPGRASTDGRFDLDRLAAGYAHRPPSEASLARADVAARRARLTRGRLAVDVGGGRGHHAGRFAATGSRSLVVDRSRSMAADARRHRGVEAIVGDLQEIPLRDGVADLVWFHASVHYGDWRRSLTEGIRIAAQGGLIEIWTFTPEHARTSFLTQWFPTVGAVDEGRFPDPHALGAFLVAGGCTSVRVREVDELVERSAAQWETGVRAMFVSTLQSVPADELEAGLASFRRAHPAGDETLRYLLRYACISGRTPSLP